MNVLSYACLLLDLMSLCVACCGQEYAAGNLGSGAEPQISWDSPRMRELEREYASLWETYHSSPKKIGGKWHNKLFEVEARLVSSLFRKRLSLDDVRQLVSQCHVLPLRFEDRSEFANVLLAFMVRSCVDRGDRALLVDLLSRRCPSYIRAHYAIEFYLANYTAYYDNYYRKTLADPILILGEAYSKCVVPEVRKELACAVRRGFAGFGIHEEDDAEFVAKAMNWYEQEKGHLAVNDRYWDNELLVYMGEYEDHPEFFETWPKGWHRQLLFLPKPSSEQSPEEDQRLGPEFRRSSWTEAFAGPPKGGSDETETNRAELLRGTWQVVEITDNGTPVAYEELRRLRCVIGATTATWTGRETEREYGIRFPEGQSQAIDFVRLPGARWKGIETTPLIQELLEEVSPAIYELRGDSLRICHAQPDARERPTSFDSAEGSGLTLIVFERVPTPLVGPVAVFVILGTLVVAALLLWPTRGLYWRWRGRQTRKTANVEAGQA